MNDTNINVYDQVGETPQWKSVTKIYCGAHEFWVQLWDGIETLRMSQNILNI